MWFFTPYIFLLFFHRKIYKVDSFIIYGILIPIYKMPSRTKIRDITIVNNSGAFGGFFKKYSGAKEEYDFGGLSVLRQLLSNEKARILHVIKSKKPGSIYELSKILKRDFKSVNEDIKLLDKFGFIDLISEKTGKRERLKPIVVVDSININLKV